MPIYEFKCLCCGDVASRLVRRPENADSTTCLRCGSADVERLISRVAILHGDDAFAAGLTSPDVLRALEHGTAAELRRWIDRVEVELGSEVRGKVDRLAAEVESLSPPAGNGLEETGGPPADVDASAR